MTANRDEADDVIQRRIRRRSQDGCKLSNARPEGVTINSPDPGISEENDMPKKNKIHVCAEGKHCSRRNGEKVLKALNT